MLTSNIHVTCIYCFMLFKHEQRLIWKHVQQVIVDCFYLFKHDPNLHLKMSS